MELDVGTVTDMLEDLRTRMEEQEGALTILRLEDRYQLATRECYTPVIRRALSERRNSALSPAAMEVLAAVACNQPVTRAYIEQVRGVDSSAVVTSLVEKGLLEEAGRLELPGASHSVPDDRAFPAHLRPSFARGAGAGAGSRRPKCVFSAEEPGDEMPDGQLVFQAGGAKHTQGGESVLVLGWTAAVLLALLGIC
jgi:segregation and condensation protein B